MFYLFLGQIACIVLSFIVCLILLGHLSVQSLNLGMISKLLMLVNANLYLHCVFWAVIIKRCRIPKRLLSQRQLCPPLMFRCSELAVWELNGLFIFRFFFSAVMISADRGTSVFLSAKYVSWLVCLTAVRKPMGPLMYILAFKSDNEMTLNYGNHSFCR